MKGERGEAGNKGEKGEPGGGYYDPRFGGAQGPQGAAGKPGLPVSGGSETLELLRPRKSASSIFVFVPSRVQKESTLWGPLDLRDHPGHQGLDMMGARVLQGRLGHQDLQVPPSQEPEPTDPTSVSVSSALE